MSPRTLDEQLNKHLTDAHSIEQQALAQMKSAPKLADDPELSEAFARHLTETEEHERLVRQALEARGTSATTVKDVIGGLIGKGFIAFASAQRDTPGKLAGFAYAFEHLEIGGYELLRRVASRAGDGETVQTAELILTEERAAAQKLSSLFAQALDASLRDMRLPAR